MNALKNMVEKQIARRGVQDQSVLDALCNVPRQIFVPEDLQSQALDDGALPIGNGQTISQPYIVGLMSELLNVQSGDRILEIGTGSGYQTAVLAQMGAQVFTIEIVASLSQLAEKRLVELGYDQVACLCGDGYYGWPSKAPFDGIVITAAPEQVPRHLVAQLCENGRLVLPVGRGEEQDLCVLIRRGNEYHEKKIIPVRFVPMTGMAMQNPREGL